LDRSCRGCALGAEVVLYSLHCALHAEPGRTQRSRQFSAMYLCVTRDDGVHHRDSDAAADVAEQVVQSAGVADFFVLEEGHGGG